MAKIIECVPNFSEGRDRAVLDALVEAMGAVDGVWVLGHGLDPDHNRSVVTLAGEPEAVAEAAVRGVGRAAELIDLTRHRGVHPRVGAADVVPFVPVEGVTLEECAELARRVGGEIWKRFRIPVYFYEAAAHRTDRVKLEDVRRGQFEGLRAEVLANRDRAPDVGEPRLHPTAGATIVGARRFLIAYNIHLNATDVSVARQIAKAIRFSSGGLRNVKAMGVELEGRNLTQVSINLTDFEQTPIHRVFEMVQREAARYGATITGSEIVGLVPRRAIETTADYYLQLENFSSDQVLENRLAKAASTPAGPRRLAGIVKPLLDAVAGPARTPGGGSAAALAGALAASLAERVAGISGEGKLEERRDGPLVELQRQLGAAREELSRAVDSDASASEAVNAATGMPRTNVAEERRRAEAVERAEKRAAEVTLRIAQMAVELNEALARLEPISAGAMRPDLATAQWLVRAAARGAMECAAARVESAGDGEFAAETKKNLAALESRLEGVPAEAVP